MYSANIYLDKPVELGRRHVKARAHLTNTNTSLHLYLK